MGQQIPPFQSAADRGYKFLCSFQILGLWRGQKKVVFVEGGVPPYTWEVSGSAFTLDSGTTSVQYNFITAADDAAVNSAEEISVVDNFGTQVYCKVKLTDYDEYDCCSGGGEGGGGGSTPHLYDCCSDPEYNLSFLSADVPKVYKWCAIHYSGGCSPYEWGIIGDADEYLTLKSIHTNEPDNSVYVSAGAPVWSPDFWDGVGIGDRCISYCCLHGVGPEFDEANSDDTIDPGGTAVVEITKGCPPYEWIVQNLGYSVAPVGDGKTAIVSCVPGACGYQWEQTCKVTVRDSCDSTDEHYIRNTGGTWLTLGMWFYTGCLCGPIWGGCTNPSCGVIPPSYSYDGVHGYGYIKHTREVGECCKGTCVWNPPPPSHPIWWFPDPVCPTLPSVCAFGTCTGAGCGCETANSIVQYWGCR